MRGKTKIVCTIGPSSGSVEMLMNLVQAGMDVARLNFSHGTHDEHRLVLDNIREVMRRTGEHITILLDLQGPKIRIGDLATPFVHLSAGSRITITTEQVMGTAERVSTTFADLPKDVHPGDIALLDDGKLQLRVKEIRGKDVLCDIVVGGILSPHKGINLPEVPVSVPSLTEKDIVDLAFGIQHDVDYIALSFVRSADDIRRLRKEIAGRLPRGQNLPVIAKIEKPQAITNIDAIIAEVDGIMVARGDLGVEMPPEDVPILQKMIIGKCNRAGKPVIIATQMLESMINSPIPTRAEASDVANAVVDGGDAVMLSGETSVGKYPLEAVEMMERIIRKAESAHISRHRVIDLPLGTVENRQDALGRSACILAEQMHAAAIVTVTRSGQTARVIARYRPEPTIIAITDTAKTLRVLNLVWGVHGVVLEQLNNDSDTALQKIQEHLGSSGLVAKGEYVVLLGGQPFFARGSTNFIKVEKVT